jgi:zinc finger CCHC domain-containing protein 9
MTRVTKLKGYTKGHPYASQGASGFVSRSLLSPKSQSDDSASSNSKQYAREKPSGSALNLNGKKKKNKKLAAKQEPICYYCGTTEHTGLDQCQEYKARLKDLKNLQRQNPQSAPKNIFLPFAECFICKQKGHLQGLCPENPKGLYPNGGGCRFCSSVRHFAVDCPLGSASSEGPKKFLTGKEQDVGVSTIGLMDLSQGADDDDVCYALFKASKVKASTLQSALKKHKVVKF